MTPLDIRILRDYIARCMKTGLDGPAAKVQQCLAEIERQSETIAEQQKRIAELEVQVKFLKMELSVVTEMKDDAIKALEAFQGYDGSYDLWAKMKRERDEAIARVAELESLLTGRAEAHGMASRKSTGTTPPTRRPQWEEMHTLVDPDQAR